MYKHFSQWQHYNFMSTMTKRHMFLIGSKIEESE